MTRRIFPPARRHVFLAMSLIALAGCTGYDRTAAQPAGGELPLDRNGGGIDVVSGAPRPTFTGEARPAVGQVHPQ